MGDEQIGKGTWIDKVADTLVKREQKLGRSLGLVRVESGLGSSGIPHIGSMGDAVRAYGIALALQNFGFKSELIAYSDRIHDILAVCFEPDVECLPARSKLDLPCKLALAF